MEVLKLVLICIVSASFGEEINKSVKQKVDQDIILRSKRSKVQPEDAVRQKHDLNHIITKTLNQMAPKRVAPKSDFRIKPRVNIPPHLNTLKANVPTVRLPIVRTPIVKEKPVNVPKHTVAENPHTPKEGLFVEDDDDVDNKAENKPAKTPTTAVHIEQDLASRENSSKTNLTTTVTKHKAENDSVNTTDKAPKHFIVEGETEKDPLSSKIENLIQVNKAADDLDEVIEQLPDIIMELLKNRKKKTKNRTKANILPSIPVKTKKKYDDLDSNEDLSEINSSSNLHNETIESIKITQQNYSEIHEKTHTPKFKTEDNKSHEKESDQSIKTGLKSIHGEISSAEIIKPPENDVRSFETPASISGYENLHDVSGISYHDGPNSNKQDYDPAFTFTKSPFVYPIKENAGAYSCKIINDDNGKSFGEDDERNITWKTWSNTELLIKTANNNHSNNGIDSIPVIPRRQEPIVTKDKPNNNCYQKPHPDLTSDYQNQRHPWFYNYFHHQNQIYPQTDDLNQPSYINYYNNVM